MRSASHALAYLKKFSGGVCPVWPSDPWDAGELDRGVAYLQRPVRYAKCMTVRDMLTALQTLPRDAELLAFEAGPLG